MLWFGNKTQIDFTAVTNCKVTEGCERVHGHSMRNQFLCHKNIILMGMTDSLTGKRKEWSSSLVLLEAFQLSDLLIQGFV